MPLLFLFSAIVLYALSGSPTPDNPGLVEALIGLLLILAIGFSGILKACNFQLFHNRFLKMLQLLFLWGLIVPTLSGVYHSNDRSLILRDILAFLFLGLPLFLTKEFEKNPSSARILCALLVLTGISFSLRTLIPAFNIWIPQDELLYLSNSPLTLFAAVLLAGTLWNNSLNVTGANIWPSFIMTIGLGILVSAMLLDVQRATIGAIFVTILFLFFVDVVRTPRKVVFPLVVTPVFIACLYPVAAHIFQAMAQKTSQVGLNMRTQEAIAVFEAISASPLSLLIGLGWGSVVASPAVGGLDVNYTHSFLTTMVLKGGLLTLALSLLFVFSTLHEIFLLFQRDRVRGLCIFWSFIIPVFLYASHKSLDFGLLLLMTGVWSVEEATLHRGKGSCKTEELFKE